VPFSISHAVADGPAGHRATERRFECYDAMASDTPLARSAPVLAAIMQVLTPLLPQVGLGIPIGEQSERVSTLLTPAGWAFSIWGVLYAGSFVFAIYQALPSQRDNALLAQLRWPAAGALLGNALWALYTQIYGLSALSSAIIIATLACLLVIYRRQSMTVRPLTAGEIWCAVVPLTALASWLTAATIVNITASLRFHGVEGGSAAPLIAGGIVLVGGLIASAAILRGRRTAPYALAFLWALAGIFSAQGPDSEIIIFPIIGAALLVIASLILSLNVTKEGRPLKPRFTSEN
jgi:hypothetical protein